MQELLLRQIGPQNAMRLRPSVETAPFWAASCISTAIMQERSTHGGRDGQHVITRVLTQEARFQLRSLDSSSIQIKAHP
jgi:hypothetical protein